MKLAGRLIMIAEMQGRDLMRRRLALLLLVALPLAFYGALSSHARDAVIPGGIAMAFSVAGAAIFSVLSTRRVDQRLVLAGFGPWELIAGRLIFLEVLALPIAGSFAALMAVVSSPTRPLVLGLGVWLVAFIAVPFGLAVGALVPVELEATLVLIGVVGIQLSLGSDSTLAKFLPFWGPRRLLDISLGDRLSIRTMALASLTYAAGLFAPSLVLMERRLRIARPRGVPGFTGYPR